VSCSYQKYSGRHEESRTLSAKAQRRSHRRCTVLSRSVRVDCRVGHRKTLARLKRPIVF
jgi:hypothetical protein